MLQAWLSIGSNLQREQNIIAALDALQQSFGQLVVSPIYENVAVGFDGPPFYNLVVGISTNFPAADLHKAMRQIEDDNGRLRTAEKFSDRSLDVDLLMLGDQVTDAGGKHLPRDDILKYGFVLKPLVDVAPDLIHPETGQSMQDHWQKFSDKESPMQVVTIDWV